MLPSVWQFALTLSVVLTHVYPAIGSNHRFPTHDANTLLTKTPPLFVFFGGHLEGLYHSWNNCDLAIVEPDKTLPH